ncbi:Hsp70 family protein [Actinoplanes sp. NPDC026670]|uniref:Hsp70 family protein n=1 Tax=Actinoplanes sp. NPDC026670 TaxID=3154700 RepID=UPI0033CDA303
MTEPILVVDVGNACSRAAIVAQNRTALLRDPASERPVWPSSMAFDNGAWLVGAAAEQLRKASPRRLLDGPRRTLENDAPLVIDGRDVPAAEALGVYLSAIGAEARRVYRAAIRRLVLTVPAVWPTPDPRRDALIEIGQAAGFTDVELIDDAVAITLDPRSGADVPDGAPVLVADLGASWTVSCVRVDGVHSQVLASRATTGGRDLDALAAAAFEVLRESAIAPVDLAAVVPAGGDSRLGLAAGLEERLGHKSRGGADPEFAAVRGAARWAERTAERRISAWAAPWRTEPVVWDVPGGRARLLNWEVRPGERYPAGAVLAQVRTDDQLVARLAAPRAGRLNGPLPQPGALVGPVLAVGARRDPVTLAAESPTVLRSVETAGTYLLGADQITLYECSARADEVRIWSAGTGEALGGFTPEPTGGSAGGRLFVDPQGRVTLIGWDDEMGLRVWDVASGTLTAQIAEAFDVRRVLVDETGWRVAVEGAGRQSVGRYRRTAITVFDLDTGSVEDKISDPVWEQRNPAFRPRSAADAFVAQAATADGQLRAGVQSAGVVLSDPAEGLELHRMVPPAPAAAGVAFVPGSDLLLVNWEFETGSRVDVIGL